MESKNNSANAYKKAFRAGIQKGVKLGEKQLKKRLWHSVEKQGLPKLNGEPMLIRFKDDKLPIKIGTYENFMFMFPVTEEENVINVEVERYLYLKDIENICSVKDDYKKVKK